MYFRGMVNEKRIDAKLNGFTHLAQHYLFGRGPGKLGIFSSNTWRRMKGLFLERTSMVHLPSLSVNLSPGLYALLYHKVRAKMIYMMHFLVWSLTSWRWSDDACQCAICAPVNEYKRMKSHLKEGRDGASWRGRVENISNHVGYQIYLNIAAFVL